MTQSEGLMPSQNPVTFTFEGRQVTAQPGQSIAAALQQTGVRTLSRSTKYHRPRGYTCGFGACGDCVLTVDGMPGVNACTTSVCGDEVVTREQGLPSAGFDVLRTADLIKPVLGAGFQFHLFTHQPRLSKLVGRVLAALAGGGRMPSQAAIERSMLTRVAHANPTMVVIGAGVSGLTAALAAAEAGIDVTIVDPDFAGGRSRVRTEPVVVPGGATALPSGLLPDLLARVRQHPAITLLTGTAIGWIDGTLPVVDGAMRTELRPRAVVVATGSYEVPALVVNHDRPGVMLADAALRLAEIEQVRPGHRAVVIAGDSRAEDVADRLRAAGVEIVEIVSAEHVQRVTGWSRATGVRVSRPAGPSARLRADLICVAMSRRPADELALHFAYADAGSHEHVSVDPAPGEIAPGELPVKVVGTAAGSAYYDVSAIRETVSILASNLTARDPLEGAAPADLSTDPFATKTIHREVKE